jgi:hypothetical protein
MTSEPHAFGAAYESAYPIPETGHAPTYRRVFVFSLLVLITSRMTRELIRRSCVLDHLLPHDFLTFS